MFSRLSFIAPLLAKVNCRYTLIAFATLFLAGSLLYSSPKSSSTYTIDTSETALPHPPESSAESVNPQLASLVGHSEISPSSQKKSDISPVSPQWDAEITVHSGDSLSTIFRKLGLTSSVPALLRLGASAKPLHRLRPGQTLYIRQDDQGLFHLMYRPTLTQETHYRRMSDGNYVTDHVDLPVEHRRRTVSGTISRTLFEAGNDAGLSPVMILKFARIFAWDIDFALEIQKGDQFKLIWDEHWIQGRHAEDGPIIAAEFINRGQKFRALRYTGKDGRTDYYTPDSKHLRKQFLRTPLDFTRISSHFNLRRLHPVLKRIRPHRGVDYAAPTGTPVYATGDGKVIHRGWKGGYGRAILIQHGTRYTTVYAHLSRYARGLKVGSKVTQGQIIGRVGSSGMSTGPHLHYEFRIDGVHRNPVRIKFPDLNPLRYAELANFRQQTWPMLIALGVPDNLRLAYANAP